MAEGLTDVRLNLGSGNNHIDGYISVDKYDKEAHVQADITDLPYGNDSVEAIVCYQVIEHIPYQLSSRVFEEMYRVLVPGGTAVVECPDFDYIANSILTEGLQDKWIWNIYGQYYRPWDKSRYEDWENNAASIHRNAWNLKRIKDIAEPLGFSVRVQGMEDKHPNYRYPENLSVQLTKN
jgi:predicted SAM-dependent methyltransferase